MSTQHSACAGACAEPADLDRTLRQLLSDRDLFGGMRGRLCLRLVHSLAQQPSTAAARDLAHRAWACGEAADAATNEALRLLQAKLHSLSLVVDIPAADEREPEPADSEGGEI